MDLPGTHKMTFHQKRAEIYSQLGELEHQVFKQSCETS